MNNWLEWTGAVGGVLAVLGTVLNARKMRSCFYVWLASNGLTVICHVSLAAYSLACRDAIFLGLAIYGLFAWRRPQRAFYRVYSPSGTKMLLTPHAWVAAAYFDSGGIVELW